MGSPDPAATPPDPSDDEGSPGGKAPVTRVELDEVSGELIITTWHDGEKTSERRERPEEA